MDIIIKSASWNPSDVVVILRSGKNTLVSDPIRDSDRISFTTSIGHSNKVIESIQSFLKFQDELCAMLGAVHGVDRKRAADGHWYGVKVLTVNLGSILQVLSNTDCIRLLFDKSGAVRNLLAKQQYKEGSLKW